MKNAEDGLIRQEEELIGSLSKEGGRYGDRSASYKAWKSCPVPGRKDEYWKYTSVSPLLKRSYDLIFNQKAFKGDIIRDESAYSLVFVNGHYSPELSDTIDVKGVVVTSLKDALNSGLLEKTSDEDSESYFNLLNESFYTDGPFISVENNCSLDKAVHIIHAISESDGLFNIRGHVRLGRGSGLKLVERWQCARSVSNFFNTHMETEVGENASFEFIKLQSIGTENNLISEENIRQAGDSTSSMSTFSLQGKLIRNNVNVALLGENANASLNGLFIGNGEQHIDNHTFVDHRFPHCESNELYKGVLEGRAKGVFNGKVIVRQDAQKTNAFQYNGNILISENAQVYSKPELEIYADDVKCSHGSTTGQLDEEALFYLRSRGISSKRAKQLLIYAFAGEVLEKINTPSIRSELDHYLAERYHIEDDV